VLIAESIVTGYVRLDGGAMFGVVPKVMWEKLCPPDDRNRIRLAMRSLLFKSKSDGKWCLIDCGTGDKWEPKLRDRYGLENSDVSLKNSLAQKGLTPEDISYLFVSHLHFDHNGGLTQKDKAGKIVPTFPQAKHYIHKAHWEHALSPHERDKASFFKEDFESLKGQVSIHWVEKEADSLLGGQVKFYCSHGHTPYLMIFDITLPGSELRLTYASDMVPTSSHVRVPFVMGYDLQPAVLIEEKKALYERLSQNERHYLFLEHDEQVECARVIKGEKGWCLNHTATLLDLLT
jgi:glyoxylase-like metal-dependent hydrolase (beta-lactamase superfamily II)